MVRKYALPVLAIVGTMAMIAVVVLDKEAPAPSTLYAKPAETPFLASVAGTGIVEASTENISIGTPVSGIVARVLVTPGVEVNAGTPLFKIDDRELQAQLLPAVARVQEAEANLARDHDRLDRGENLAKANDGAISAEDLYKRRFTVRVSEAALATARAEVERIHLLIERHRIVAPVAGRIMQVKIRPGEFAMSGVLNPPLMLLGDNSKLQIRVDVNEHDAWRIKPGAAATAFVRGNPKLKADLQFERIEPYILPKTSLTGESIERTDTRVLQVIFRFDPAALPVYPGQQVDVFIEAAPVATALHAER
jgi:RND family efflux transporter MFP subunit